MKNQTLLAACFTLVGGLCLALDDITPPPGGDFYGIGGGRTQAVTSLTAAETVLASGGIYGVGAGSASNGICTATEIAPCVQKTVLTFAAFTKTFTDGSDEGESQLLYTFPEGRIYILGAAINAAVTNDAGFEASANDTWHGAIGTAAAGDDADLTGTEADIIAKTTFDTASGTAGHHEWEADMTAGGDSVFDGTATAVSLYANFAAANGSITTNNATAGIQAGGTLNVYWIHLGDD